MILMYIINAGMNTKLVGEASGILGFTLSSMQAAAVYLLRLLLCMLHLLPDRGDRPGDVT